MSDTDHIYDRHAHELDESLEEVIDVHTKEAKEVKEQGETESDLSTEPPALDRIANLKNEESDPLREAKDRRESAKTAEFSIREHMVRQKVAKLASAGRQRVVEFLKEAADAGDVSAGVGGAAGGYGAYRAGQKLTKNIKNPKARAAANLGILLGGATGGGTAGKAVGEKGEEVSKDYSRGKALREYATKSKERREESNQRLGRAVRRRYSRYGY